MAMSMHPLIDNGFSKGKDDFSGGTLSCHCSSDPVTVQLSSNVAHNHVCGCSKCWHPKGTLFSLIGALPSDKLSVTANESKISPVDPDATIVRYACKQCGVHMYGRIRDSIPAHAFKGLDFVHVELAKDGGKGGWQEPQFAAFVSSLIEQGLVSPDEANQVRDRLKKLGLEAYDCLSPGLMDFIATFQAKQAGVLKG